MFVFVAFILIALVGMAALVIDVGSWFHAQRKLQTAADAAALAGAQHLPTQQSTALTVALDYAQRNDSGIPAPTVTFPNTATIHVAAKADTPGIFAPVLNSAFGVVTVHATRRPGQCPEQPEERRADRCQEHGSVHRPESELLRPDDHSEVRRQRHQFEHRRTDRPSLSVVVFVRQLRRWPGRFDTGGLDSLRAVLAGTLPSSVWYDDKTGETIGPIKSALNDAAAAQRTSLLSRFRRRECCAGSFHVIGWAAFVIDVGGVDWGSHVKSLTGHFVTFIATDVAGGNPNADPANDFGVHVITLTK